MTNLEHSFHDCWAFLCVETWDPNWSSLRLWLFLTPANVCEMESVRGASGSQMLRFYIKQPSPNTPSFCSFSCEHVRCLPSWLRSALTKADALRFRFWGRISPRTPADSSTWVLFWASASLCSFNPCVRIWSPMPADHKAPSHLIPEDCSRFSPASRVPASC